MRKISVLLVEDNPADVELTMAALEENRLTIDLAVASNGVDALEMLHQRGAHAGRALPDLVVLDLNIPRITGKAVLAEMKSHPALKVIPVVVLTSSSADSDVVHSYDLGANCYVTKPLDMRSFQDIVRSMEAFWFTIVRLPSTADPFER